MNADPLNKQCPFCKAVTGAPCVRADGVKRKPHAQRRASARPISSNPLMNRQPPPQPVQVDDPAICNIVASAKEEIRALVWSIADKPCTTDGSPIEKALRVAYHTLHHLAAPDVLKFVNEWKELPFCDVTINVRHPCVFICPQAEVGNYRADFLLVCRHISGESKFERIVAVECDGYEFHDRSKAAIERDKARDRYFASQNILVMRFAGSEIHRDALRCATETLAPIVTARNNWFDDQRPAA